MQSTNKRMTSTFFKLNSLRSRLMLLVALAILPSVLMTFYSGWKERYNVIQTAEESQQRLTILAAENMAQSLHSARQTLIDLSNAPDLLSDSDKCNALTESILKKNPDYANLGLIQLNGDITCSAIPSSSVVNLADRAHFKRAIAERKFIAGNYVFGRLIQKHTINLTYPVIDKNNNVAAVVFIALDLVEFDKFIDSIRLPSGSILITTDGEGAIISRRPDPEKWFGVKVSPKMSEAMANQQPLVSEESNGVTRLHTFASVGASDLSDFKVSIGVPLKNIIASAQRNQITALMTLAATTILALLATWFVGERMIVRRVRVLVDTAKKIESGQLDARTGIQYGREEISYLAQALDDMARSLQSKHAEHEKAERELRVADRRKDEFLAMLAHELRNPLAPISAAAQLLKLTDSDAPHVKQTSDIIERQVHHMTSLVDDLLDVSRVTRGLVTVDREPLDIRDAVSDAMEQVATLVKTRRHELTLHLPSNPVMVNGDKKRLVQVISNLLSNSAKYTPEGGKIELCVEVHAEQVELRVIDNGIGMTPELISRVFEPFSQAERTSDRSQGGLGLGLALVRSLVELHGGTVHADSKGTGAGSTFTIRLQCLASSVVPPALQRDDTVAPVPARALRVLVVDDNTDAAHTLEIFLKTAGHFAAVEHHAQDALECARKTPPNVCLLDIGLPDIDGNELARCLRRMPETANAVLIAITGYGQEQDRENAFAAGFDYHFVKPVDTRKLAALLAEISAEYGLETASKKTI
jgi:signal transduction histidine kinase/ActR/RegA family two-component response regulator